MNDRTSHPSTHSISSWAFDRKPEPTREEKNEQWHAFRARLERRVTEGMQREHELTTAPPEVIRRTIQGRVVVQRRGGR